MNLMTASRRDDRVRISSPPTGGEDEGEGEEETQMVPLSRAAQALASRALPLSPAYAAAGSRRQAPAGEGVTLFSSFVGDKPIL